MLEQENDMTRAWVFPFSSPSFPTPSNVAVTVPVHRVSVVTPVPTFPVSVFEHTIKPCIDPPAFNDDSELKANIRKFIVQFLDNVSATFGNFYHLSTMNLFPFFFFIEQLLAKHSQSGLEPG